MKKWKQEFTCQLCGSVKGICWNRSGREEKQSVTYRYEILVSFAVKKHGLDSLTQDVAGMVSHATQERDYETCWKSSRLSVYTELRYIRFVGHPVDIQLHTAIPCRSSIIIK